MIRLDISEPLPEGEVAYTYWVVQVDEDVTQRIQPMLEVGFWATEESAFEQAVALDDAEIDQVTVLLSNEVQDNLVFVRQKVYGYRKSWNGTWDYGWVDNRDAPVNDPEYDEYLRLKRKFEGS